MRLRFLLAGIGVGVAAFSLRGWSRTGVARYVEFLRVKAVAAIPDEAGFGSVGQGVAVEDRLGVASHYELGEAVENQDVKDIIRRMKALWIDMSESQSADLASGINRFDLARFSAIVDSCRALLAMSGSSIDLPENSGNMPVPTSGGATRVPGGAY